LVETLALLEDAKDIGIATLAVAFLFGLHMTARQIPTLGDLQRTTPWIWLWCERCQHHAPLACAVAVIRWGADVSSDRLRQRARCTHRRWDRGRGRRKSQPETLHPVSILDQQSAALLRAAGLN
jgi:hypothetical protein